MPPRKKQKTELEQELAAFLEKANNEFAKAKRDKEYITVFKFKQIVNKFELEFDDTLLSDEDHEDGLQRDRFIELMEQLKREADLSRLVDYIYNYLSYNTDSEGLVGFETFIKSLKTLPKTPKRNKTIELAYCFANEASIDDPLTRHDLVKVLRQVQFFQKHYQEFNVNESFLKEDEKLGRISTK